MSTKAKILGDKSPIALTLTGLATLANAAGVATDAQIDPSSQTGLDGYLYMDLVLDVTWGTAPTVDNTVDAYIVHGDGVREQEYTAGATPKGPANGFIGSFVIHSAGTDQELFLPNALVPAKPFRLMLINSSGVAFTTATLYAVPHTEQGV